MTDKPDPQTVREIATEHILDDARRAYDIGADVLGHFGPDGLTKPEYHAYCDAVRGAIETATVSVSWPDEQPPTGRPAADLAHAAEDLRKHLDLRARAVNDEVLIHPEVLSVARADGHSHALMESVVRTLLAERDALAAYVDRLATPDDDAIHSAAILRDWFKSEGSLAMDEEDLNHVQTVLADYEHIVAGPTVTASQPDEQPQDDEVQHARTFLAGLRENITGYHQPLPGQPEHCTCGGASGCDRGADDLAAIATLEAALNTAAPQYTVDGQPVDRESYEAWADEGRAAAGIGDYDERDVDDEGNTF